MDSKQAPTLTVNTLATNHVNRSTEVEEAIKEFNLNSSSVTLLDLCSITTIAEGLRKELIDKLRLEESKKAAAAADGDYNSSFAPAARKRILEQYSGEHSLSEACLSFLEILTIPVLADVLTSFSPVDEDFNVALMNYAAEKKAGFKDGDRKSPKEYVAPEVLTFTRQWNLNDASTKLLQSLPIEVINDVMLNFRPRDVSRDVNPVFGSFVKSRLYPSAYLKDGSRHTYIDSSYGSPHGPMPWQWDYSWNNSYAIDSFVRQWHLNESAVHLLNTLSPEVFNDVVTYFNPKDTTRDVNAIFQAFARSRANASYQPSETLSYFHGIPTPVPSMFYGEEHRPTQPPTIHGHAKYNDFDVFSSYWGLNNNATKLLKSLPYDQQFEVMQNFCPKDVSRDVNPVFIAFAKSRVAQRGIRKGGGF